MRNLLPCLQHVFLGLPYTCMLYYNHRNAVLVLGVGLAVWWVLL